MRPVKLIMQAFGSYGKLTQIDFQEPNQNLFLVTGDTGAGKTTIFDALVFALYGEASSSTNKKDGVVLQSQYAELNVEPFVELVFSEGTGENSLLYTVRRVPRHLKLLTRGAGKNTGSREVPGSVSLIMPDGTEYPQKEADSKLGEILGLTKSQFMQVAMIAQGEFMELLRAKSDDKKVIFRKLFNTELYQNIVDELMNRKRSLEKEIAQIKTACQTEAAHVVIPQEYDQWQEIEGLKKQVLNGEIVVMDCFMDHLGELCRTLEKSVNFTSKELQSASKLRDEKRDIYNSSIQLTNLYAQLESAEVQLSECGKVEAQIGEKTILSEKIKKAYEIKGEYARCQDALRNMQTCESALKEQQERAPLLKEQSQSVIQTAKAVKETAEKELKAYTTIYERVNKEVKLLKQIKEAEKSVKTSQQNLTAAQAADRKAREDLEKMEKQEADWRAQSEKLTDTNEKIAVWKGKNQELEVLGIEVQETEDLLKGVETQKKLAKKARETYQKNRTRYDAKSQEYESMRRIFLDEQAGFLARELQPGKPCPVCGAIEHPNPCIASTLHRDLTREQLELAEKEGYTFIHPFDDPAVATGQGTIAMEIIKELPLVDYILVPIGGGGLATGVSTLAKMLNPNICVIGVEPAGAACMKASLQAGEVVTLPNVNTIADGTAVKTPGKNVFPYLQKNLDDIITIEDDDLIVAFLDMVENHKMIVENSGLLTVAALKYLDVKDKKVVSILSGGNMDVITMSSVVQLGLIQRDRIFTVSVLLPDKAGELVRVATVIANEQGNVIKLDHNQFVSTNRNAAVELKITLEAFGTDHKERIVNALKEHGYNPKVIRPNL